MAQIKSKKAVKTEPKLYLWTKAELAAIQRIRAAKHFRHDSEAVRHAIHETDDRLKNNFQNSGNGA
jgi:hypothetical protein